MEQDCAFPKDLHYTRDESGNIINLDCALRVKNALEAELPDFLNYRGRWSGETNGKYWLYSMVGDANGLTGKVRESVLSNLLDDNTAANRYDHMAYRSVENMLFYNPLFLDERDVRLDLATRILNTANDTERQNDAIKLGYDRKQIGQNSRSNTIFINTDPTGYRAALEAALQSGSRQDLQFDLNVQSIQYNGKYQKHQGFLYLADTLCSVYETAVNQKRNLPDAFSALYKYCSRFVPENQVLLWAYSEIDNQFRHIFKEYEHGNIFESMKMICDIRGCKDALSALYDRIWLIRMETLLAGNTDLGAQLAALEKLELYLGAGKRKLSTVKEILNLLKKQPVKIYSPYMKEKVQFLMAKIEMSMSNHLGDHLRAERVYQEVVKAVHYSDMEELLGMQLVLCVSYSDALQFEKEEKLAREIISHYELLSEIRKDIYQQAEGIYPSNGRACSQLGQCLSYQQRWDESMEWFRKAIVLFGDSVSDIIRTKNYMMHTCIESGNQADFLTLFRECYKLDQPRDAFFDAADKYDAFDYYLILKYIWLFEKDQISAKGIRQIMNRIAPFTRQRVQDHPWEQIFKYTGLLILYRNKGEQKDEAVGFMKAMMESIPEESMTGILRSIQEEARQQFENVKNGLPWDQECRLTYMYR